MLDRILRFSIHRNGVVILLVLALAALGAWNFTRLPIDAVPDITNVQVMINTEAPGFTPPGSGTAIPAAGNLVSGIARISTYPLGLPLWAVTGGRCF